MVCDGSEGGPTKAFRDAAAAAAIRIGILNFSRKPNSKTKLVLKGTPLEFRAWAWVMHSCFLGTAWNQALELGQDYHRRNWQRSAMSIRGVAEKTIRQKANMSFRVLGEYAILPKQRGVLKPER